MLLHKEELEMKRLVVLLFLAVGASWASDVHYMWLPFSSNVPGAPQTNTAVTQWGINIMMDSDNPKVTEFEVTVVARLASGEIRTVDRQGRTRRKSRKRAILNHLRPLIGFRPEIRDIGDSSEGPVRSERHTARGRSRLQQRRKKLMVGGKHGARAASRSYWNVRVTGLDACPSTRMTTVATPVPAKFAGSRTLT